MNIVMDFIAAYTIAASVYLLVFAIASKFPRKISNTSSSITNRILILLPVYKEDEVILESARKALSLDYDRSKFDVAVIADTLQGTTRVLLNEMGCIVVNMNLLPRSKAKAINLALREIPEVYDICVVLDADNYFAKDALIQINSAFNAGAKAIQCQRVAKEITTPVSVLDALSEGINNSIFRKGHRAINLSAALAGSGMAFEYFLFQKVMRRIEATNGFDKDLEFEIISSDVKIEYLENVPVFDEKVSSLEVLQKQRTRWFAAQVINIKKGFFFFIKNPSIDLLDKWWQMFLPSRLLLIGFFFAVTIVSVIFQNNLTTTILAACTVLTAIALLIAAPFRYLKENGRALLHLPISFVTLIFSVLSIGKARKGFIHTPHSHSKA